MRRVASLALLPQWLHWCPTVEVFLLCHSLAVLSLFMAQLGMGHSLEWKDVRISAYVIYMHIDVNTIYCIYIYIYLSIYIDRCVCVHALVG